MRLLTVAKWELTRRQLGLGKRLAGVSVLLFIITLLSAYTVAQIGFHLNDGIYSVAVNDKGIAAIVSGDPKFNVYLGDTAGARQAFDAGKADLLVIDGVVSYRKSQRSIAALDALDRAIVRYDEERFLALGDLNSTYPVRIIIHNVNRESSFQLPQRAGDAAPTAVAASTPPPALPREQPAETAQDELVRQSSGARNPLALQTFTTPSHLAPPLPFRSVVLTFFFIFPMYFVAQFYSASIMEERIKKRGELLLASPVRPADIVLGKMLPYLLLIMLLALGILVWIGGTASVLWLLLPVALAFLSTSLLASVLARSFKELTFVLVFISICLSSYLFIPAMFINIHAVSSVSPMALAVKMLEGESITTGEYLFSTVPLYFVSALVIVFGIFTFNAETLFSQKPVGQKLADGLSVFMGRVPYPLFFLGILAIPLAYTAQLMLVTLLFNFPMRFAIPAFILLAAFIEEFLKSVGIYTLVSRGRKTGAIMPGVMSGAGFFAGEKMILLLLLAPIAESAYGSVMGVGWLVYPLLFSLALHVTSACVTSIGLKYLGTRHYLLVLSAASMVHGAYNYLNLVRSGVLA
ncbi:MAG TPA: ABC transporter permease [Candidatus Methanoperedenaceae archaeon]|nr:ABC transporter permease [Candidatus Methanoperedenaceae archaeon]